AHRSRTRFSSSTSGMKTGPTIRMPPASVQMLANRSTWHTVISNWLPRRRPNRGRVAGSRVRSLAAARSFLEKAAIAAFAFRLVLRRLYGFDLQLIQHDIFHRSVLLVAGHGGHL